MRINPKNKRAIIASVLLVVSIIGVQFYFLCVGTEIVRDIKVADCTNNLVKFHLRVPKGHSYFLILTTTDHFSFAGQVQISDATHTKIEFPIGTDLTGQKNTRIFLSQNTNSPFQPLDSLIQAGKDYDFEITFDKAP